MVFTQANAPAAQLRPVEQVYVMTNDASKNEVLAQSGRFAHVLNQGAYGGVTVFGLEASGRLRRIPKSTVLLAATGAGTASLAVNPDAKFLAVVERLATNIDICRILPEGSLSAITITPSQNPGVFSAIFSQGGQLPVTETVPTTATKLKAARDRGVFYPATWNSAEGRRRFGTAEGGWI
jgi:6-phosphogluconolactonase (cycloisomerase 2 family)